MATKPARGNGGLDGLNGRDGRDSRPVPDPTVRTDQLVSEAVGALREVLEAKIEGQRAVFEARFSGNEQAVKLLQTILDRQPIEVDVKVGHLQSLHEEKFNTVAEKFNAVEKRSGDRDDKVTEAKADAKVGIDAALASAEKLVGQSNDSFREMFEKAERSTEKLLDKQDENQKTTSSNLEDRISGLKERLDRIEGAAVGMVTQKTEGAALVTNTRSDNSFALQMVMGLVTVIAVVFSIVMALRG